MSLRLTRPKTRARLLLIAYGLILLIWMSLEDRGTLSVSLLGTGATLVYLGTWIINRYCEQDLALCFWFSGMILSGAVIGATANLSTVILMFFKSGWHGHLYPDYPPQIIGAMLTRMPVWAISGTLLGFCCAIFILLRQSSVKNNL